MIDPYHRWLGIPPDSRPPTYYQLLGISPDESDPEVITEAALRQTSHVRTYQTGPHAEACTKLLNEIAVARKTLLNADKRRDYDAQLGVPTSPAPPLVEVECITLPPTPLVEVERITLPAAPRPRRRPSFDARDGLYILVGAGCMLIAQLLLWGVVRLLVLIIKPRRSTTGPE